MVLIDKKDLGYKMKIGSAMPQFSLPGTDGKTHAATELRKKAQVILFWCNHCPYVHGAERQVNALVERYGTDVDVVAINSNDAINYPDDSFAKMQEKEHDYLYLRDEDQSIAREFGAECTPHVFMFVAGKLVYQGRVDDAEQSHDPTTHELQDAIEDALAGNAVRVPETSAMGCSIKWT